MLLYDKIRIIAVVDKQTSYYRDEMGEKEFESKFFVLVKVGFQFTVWFWLITVRPG